MQRINFKIISVSIKYAILIWFILLLEILFPITLGANFITGLFNIFGSIVFVVILFLPIITLLIFALLFMKKVGYKEKKWAGIFLFLLNCFSIAVYFVIALHFDDNGVVPVFITIYGTIINFCILLSIILYQILDAKTWLGSKSLKKNDLK